MGRRIHKYEIVRVIGRGGMGTVYEALNTDIGKRVAMKFVDATGPGSDADARFQREAQAASAVESAHIVEIFDSGTSEDGRPYIVMELLRGEDLGHRIKRCGRLELPEALHVTAQLLRGLDRAHKAGIVHRDLKPDNVFLVDRDDDPNFAKILDFGISKVRRPGETPVSTLTRQGTVLGTPFYMSPEQAQAQPDVDGRTDLWSVGAILYECLSGRPPYTGATYEQVIVNICMNDAEDVRVYNPAVPEGVADVLARALARDREERFTDAREFLEALRAVSGGVISARSGGTYEDSSSGVKSSDLRRSSTPGSRRPSSSRRFQNAATMADPALEPTLEVITGDRGAKVGWTSNRSRAAKKERRTFVVVALSALLLGSFGAFLVVKSRAPEAAASGGEPSARPAQTGAPAQSAAAPSATIVAEAPPATAAAPADSSAAVPADDHRPIKNHPLLPVVSAKPKSSGGAVDPPPPGTGVAPGLKLKTD